MLPKNNTAANYLQDTERTSLSIIPASGAGLNLVGIIRLLDYLIASFPGIALFVLLAPMQALCENPNPNEPEMEEIEILTLNTLG